MTNYKRILLKLSGESLMGNSGYGIDSERLNEYAQQIKEIVDLGVQVGIVIGGGNIFRGLSGVSKGFDRVTGDQMGMLATIINSLALESELKKIGQKAAVFTSIRMKPIGIFYTRDEAVQFMEKNGVAIIAGGTGNPFFTTDTASALRGVEIGAQVLLKGTRVDGVYTADPEKDASAVKYDKLSFDEALDKKLKVMDSTAFTLCRDNNLSIIVFDMDTYGNLKKVLTEKGTGTLVYL